MTINTKISVFVIGGFFLASICLGSFSVITLLNNQRDSLKTAKSEVLEISREMTQENANFVLNLLDSKLHNDPSLTYLKIMQYLAEIDHGRIDDIIIIDMKSRKVLQGKDSPWFKVMVDQRVINNCLNNYLLNNRHDFYLDNYGSFLTDKNNSITPIAVHLRIGSVIILIYFMKISFIKPLEQISLWAFSIAEGDLTARIRIDQKDEIGDLARDFNKMVDNLQKITVSRDDLIHENIARKRAEEEAAAAGRAKGEFLANMSHEIRTPLNAILGFSDLLSATKVDEQQRGYLNTIASSGEILISLINDILDSSKLEAGKVQLETIDFDLENLVNDVFNMAKIRFKGKEITPYIDWDAQVPHWVKGDPTRIRQILLNFLNNATKFTEKGEIGLIVRLEETTPQGPVVQFCVKDSGIGIPEDKQNKLFSSFSQADSSTTRKYGGTGLGLAISKKLVEAMGGKVWLDSQEGRGSQFFFTVPFGIGISLIQQAIDPLSKEQLVDKVVLCVDDHQASLEIVTRYCQEIGLKVIAVSGAAQALEQLNRTDPENLPELILSDIRMPDMDGYMMAEKVRSQSRFNKIKIVALTSDARIGGAVFAQEKGFNAYLPKPVMRNDLIKVISTVLGDRRPVSAPIITRHIASEVGLKGIKVLVVDDVLSNQQLMKAYLDMFGCISEFAGNGQEAIDKIRAGFYDICLMDVQMPVLDGIEATRIIRAEINKDIPIIALTAAVRDEHVERTLLAGMNAFLIKPIEINILKSTLLKFVSSPRS